ncbi:MAG: site-specific integrase [Pseudomonadota bacterium]
MKWRCVDFDAGVLRLPASKTGAKLVPVGQAALAFLRTIPKHDDNPFVIAGRVPGQYVTDTQHPWQRIRKRAGLQDVRIHDLRHSFASDALPLGHDLPMIGKLLGHSHIQTTARQIRSGRPLTPAIHQSPPISPVRRPDETSQNACRHRGPRVIISIANANLRRTPFDTTKGYTSSIPAARLT